jgi:Domain of unknown function (DUF4442)
MPNKKLGWERSMNFTMNPEAENQPPFAALIGMKLTHVSPDKVIAELPVREELNNRFGALHGGAVMALADNLGGTATIANLPKGGRTATRLKAKPISSPASPSATWRAPSAPHFIAAAPRWFGRRALRVAMASYAPWSFRPRS